MFIGGGQGAGLRRGVEGGLLGSERDERGGLWEMVRAASS